MSLSDILREQPERYQSEHGDWLPADRIAALLTTGYEIPNPTPRGKVPAPFDIDVAIGAMSPETCAKLAAMAPIVDFVSKARSGDREGAWRWIGMAAKAGILQPEELEQLQQMAAAEIDDPAWQPTVIVPAKLGSVRVDEIEKALEEINRDNN